MRIGFQIILYLLILNLVSTLALGLAIPGTEQSNILNTGQQANATSYTSEFNATSLLDKWRATPFTGIPILGDVFSMVYMMYNGVRSILLGFPDLVSAYAYTIPDATGRTTLLSISYLVYAVFMFIIFMWVFQLVTGRRVTE